MHMAAAFYDVDGFRRGGSSLQPFEVDEVGDVAGLDLVHLQCHFGLDTLSWARLGARVTGLDFSAPAISAARALAGELRLPATFVEAAVDEAPARLGAAAFDIVYTGHGALLWLPDMPRWAGVVATLLRPGGCCYLSEFHPFSDVVDDTEPRLTGDYFDRGPFRVEEPGSYADPHADTRHDVSYEWNHTLADVVGALLAAGLQLELLRERPYTLFPRFPWLERRDDGTWWPPPGAPRVPLMYSLRVRKPPAAGPAAAVR